MQINVTYDASVDAAPAAFKTTVQYAINLLDAAFSNNAMLNIHVGWGEVEGSPLDPGNLGESEEAQAPAYTYSGIVSALNTQAAQPNASADLQAAVATLQGLPDPTGGGVFDIGTAEAKALGLLAANAPGVDGWVGFDSTASDWSFDPTAIPAPGLYYLVGTIEHEITEVMGRNSYLGLNNVAEHYNNGWTLPDLFRFASPGVRQLTPGPGHTTAYFSIDNGNTDLGTWNNHVARGDLADWDQAFGSGGGPGPNGNDAFNDFSNYGVLNQITNTDLTLMHVSGWQASQPLNVVINGETYLIDLVHLSASGLVIMPGGSVDVAAGGHLVGPLTFDGAGGSLEIDNPNAPGNFIKGFVAGDTIDFFGAAIGTHPTVMLEAGNVLEIIEHNTTYDFKFDPGQDFTGQNFHVADDGFGGTLVFIDPSVASVTTSGPGISAGSGDLGTGQSATFSLNMNETVNVDTAGGTPTLSLNDGGIATYSGGSGTSTLAFNTTVAPGQNTPDLAVTAFNLNGAAIQDPNGHTAVLTNAVGNPAGTLQVDTTAYLTGITQPPGSGTMVFSFDEAVKTTAGALTLALSDGLLRFDPAATAALHDSTELVFDVLSIGAWSRRRRRICRRCHGILTDVAGIGRSTVQGRSDAADFHLLM